MKKVQNLKWYDLIYDSREPEYLVARESQKVMENRR